MWVCTWMFFTFLNIERYYFYDILSFTRGRPCSSLIRYGILYDTYSYTILGPPLFLICINDIINASKFLHLILFADDTNIFLHHSDLNILQSISNVELDKLSEWFKSNRLSLNIKKTNYILFSPKSKCRQQLINSFTIQIGQMEKL